MLTTKKFVMSKKKSIFFYIIFFHFYYILLVTTGCNYTPIRLDVSVSESSRIEAPMPVAPRDYLKIGREAIEKNDYQTAFLNFHAFWSQNSENMHGPLFCGQAKMTEKEYQRALYYYREAANISSDDIRTAWGILLCHRAIFEESFINSIPYLAEDKEKEVILETWKQFKTALNEYQWTEISKNLSLLEFAFSTGITANSQNGLEEHIKNHLGFLTSSPMIIYINMLQVQSVRSNGKIAEIQLTILDHLPVETIYLKKEEQAWRIAMLFPSLTTQPSNLLSYQNLENLETPIPSPLDIAKFSLVEKIKIIWNWQEQYRVENTAFLKKLVPEIIKKLEIIDLSKTRIAHIFEGKFNDVIAKKLLAMIHNSIERIENNQNISENFHIEQIFIAWEQTRKDLLNILNNLTTYGIPKEIWEKCSYHLRGIWILDMSSPAWENLSDADQKQYAKKYQEEYALSLHKPIEDNYTFDNIPFSMVLIPPGRFWMGSLPDEPGRKHDERRYRVILPMPFYIGKQEITQWQWQRVMNYNSSYFRDDRLPVEQVSWYDCIRFCNKVNLRIPSEAEWEYSCRAGLTAPFNLGSRINAFQVNYNGNYPCLGDSPGTYRQKTIIGATLPNANSWGCYDFHGNVWEWCYDWYGDYPLTEQINPMGGSSELQRVSRGGGWSAYASSCRSADRSKNEPGFRFIYLGLRVVRYLE